MTFTEQANTAYRHLRGRLPCAVKPIGPHRASEYALNLSGTAFGLLGVMLERLFGNRHRLPHQEPSHNRSPAVLRLISGRSMARGPRPQMPQWHPRVAKRSSDRSSARGPCPQVLQCQPRVARGSSGHSSARRPLPQVSQCHPGVAKGSAVGSTAALCHGHLARKPLSGIPAWRRGSSDRSLARRPRLQVPQGHPRVATVSWCIG